MVKEEESVLTLEDEQIDNEKSLLLHNDDYNTFEYVIDTLMKVCGHTLNRPKLAPGLRITKANAPSNTAASMS